MQGINRNRHAHVANALLELERFFHDQKDDEGFQETAQYRQKLEILYNRYEQLLKELAEHIAIYEAFQRSVKIGYFAKRLKKLKKG